MARAVLSPPLSTVTGIALLSTLSLSGEAFAHIGEADAKGPFGAFLAGLSHPVLGPDHFLAMFSVGLVSAIMGHRHFWLVPLTFVAAMPVGWLLGRVHVVFPPVELGIAVSVIALGAAAMWAQRLQARVVYAAVAVFALFHGYAHGSETPVGVDLAQYALGFMVGTAGIHLLGLFVGDMIHRDDRQNRAEKWLAGGVMLAGAWFLYLAGTASAPTILGRPV